MVDRAAAPLEVIVGCFAIDGDTLNCDGEIVRLLGIDAPEMPGSCATGRDCVPGDPFVSRAALIGALQYEMKVERVGYDVYGRSLALVYTERNNLSCSQLAASQAAYIEDWDDGGRVRAACPGIVLNAPSIHHR
ncbi:MAG: nuclease [Sphingopyxis macrogoltabida]|uniref:Nuclease n=1 Tax=Sphingopyxis macrogoltabida TaxID=33050 RepID=A0A2W5L480_SPHMC|nr:MAG: nuclease [Sphingopyxis macrogoltabida]